MKRLRNKASKFFSLPPEERRMLLQAAAALSTARIAMRLLPFNLLRRAVARLARMPSNQHTAAISLERAVWAIESAGRHLPGRVSCLAQALTAQVLLTRRGFAPHVRIGVAREEDGRLAAHAWVEAGGRVILGEARDPDRFSPLPPFRMAPR